MKMWSMDGSESFPAEFRDITNYVGGGDVYVCPCSGRRPLSLTDVDEWTDFILVSGLSEGDPSTAVQVFCPPQNHGGQGAHVLRVDGSVEWLSRKEFEALVGNLTLFFGLKDPLAATNRLLDVNINIPARLGITLESLFPAKATAKAVFEGKPVAEQVREIVSCSYYSRRRLSQVILKKGDAAVPALAELLNDGDKVAEVSGDILGQMDTQESRRALIRAYEKAEYGRERLLWALARHPHRDAEAVFIDALAAEQTNRWAIRCAAAALGNAGSQRAIPYLQTICDKPADWYQYYAALVALRKVRDGGLPASVESALQQLRGAGFDKDGARFDSEQAETILRDNMDIVLPDLVDMGLGGWASKGGSPLSAKPIALRLLKSAGDRVRPYLEIAARDDSSSWRTDRVTNLAHELSITLDLNGR